MTAVMRILVGCETSGVVRRAFAARGHDVWSVDLLPSDDRSNHHIIGDVRDYLNDGWDFLAVMHPPCTRLCNSGVRWLSTPPPGKTSEQMWAELDEGVALFSACWSAPIERVVIENPIMHRHARERMPVGLPKPQIVQPWWFGDPAFKATGLYRRGLPPLVPTNKLTPPVANTDEHRAWSMVHRASPSPDRWKIRSKTFAGIANAFAEQWTTDAIDACRRYFCEVCKMTAKPSGKFASLCRQLWQEQGAQIAQIHSGAARGDKRSQALLAQIETFNTKLRHIEELGKFVARMEANNVDQS